MFNGGVRGKRAKDGTGFLSVAEQFNQQTYLIPTVTSFSVTDVSYVPYDDTAVDTAGGQTIVINGSGFAPGATVQVGATTIGSVTYIDQNRLAFSAPALSSGSYTIYVTNSNGGTGILVSGLVYSGLPTYTTSAGSLGTIYETANINTAVVATGDAPITYTLLSGTLPSGATLNSNGTITGNAPIDGSSTTYSFTIQATDAQLQDSTRAFTLTINTDVLSWSLANNTVYTLDGNIAMSNVTLSATSSANANSAVTYAANTLPTGVSLSGNTIYGTPTVEQTVYSALTATAASTGRTATRYVSWSVSLGDTYFKNSTVLLNTALSANTFVSDSSLFNQTVTPVGDTKPSNINPYVLGYYSNFFDGTGDYLQNSSLAPNITIGSSDFCIEAWGYWTSFNNGTYGSPILSLGGTNSQLMIRANKTSASSTSANYYSTSNSTFIPSAGYSSGISAGTIYLNQWTHFAVSRQGSTWRMFINGSLVSTQTDAASLAVAYTSIVIGADTTPANGYMTGWISNARVVVGDAIYTAAFTPPTAPLTAIANTKILSCQSNRHIDNSLNNYALTKNGDVLISQFAPFTTPTSVNVNNLYSTYFDGTGDYLTTSGTYTFGTSNFTIEAWVYTTAYPGSLYAAIFGNITTVTGDTQIILSLNPSGNVVLLTWGTVIITTSAVVSLNAWTHIAAVRDGAAYKVYINGTLAGTSTTMYNLSTAGAANIGYAGLSGISNFTGSISNMRILQGTALYTSNFTAPTTTLTAIANTTLLTCQSSTLVDNSNNAFTITSSGDARPIPISPFTQTTTSVTTTNLGSTYFDGTGDYLTIPANAALSLGAGDFTAECWINITGTQTATYGWGVFGTYDGASNAGWSITVNRTTGTYGIYTIASGAGQHGYTTAYIPTNTWTHIAVVRSGSGTNNLKTYLNGVQVAASTYTTNDTLAATCYIGSQGTGSNFPGHISNVRFVKGTALYTANFHLPTQPLTSVANTTLLTCQTNQPSNNTIFVDNSGSNLLISRTGNTAQGSFTPYGDNWSNYFDGTGDYLTVGSTAQNLTGDFTVEAWVFQTAQNSFEMICGSGTNYFATGSTNTIELGFGASAVYPAFTTGSTIPLNTWNHVAITRSGTSIRAFLNGTQVGTAYTSSDSWFATNALTIGQQGQANYWYYHGNISNFRIVKGTALYTTSFTPPTAPLTAVANTTLLTCQSNRYIDNSPSNFTVTKSGDVAVQSFSPFSRTTVTPISYSNYFDGTGDYFVTPSISSFTGNFTIEFWYYPEIPTNSWYPYIFGTNTPWTSGGGVGVVYDTQSTVTDTTSLNVQVASGVINIGTYATVKNKWNHIAIVRSGSTITVYLNGASVGTPLTNSSTINTTTYMIGGVDEGGSYDNHAIKGYISNFRILTGTALYTSNFTPSTTPLTAIANTTLLTCQSSTIVDNSNNAYSLTITGNAKPLTQNPFGVTSTASSSSYSPTVYGSSAYFDGTGDSLSTTATGQFVATTDFTISLWFYTTSLAATNHLIGNYTANLTTDWLAEVTSGGTLQVFLDGSTLRLSHTGITTNQWYHLTITRSGTTVTGRINGVTFNTTATYTMSGTLGSATKAIYLGMRGASSNPLFGYLSDVRLVSGSALYTGNFVTPTTPSTAVKNTTMLLSMDKAGITDVTAKTNFDTLGDVKVVYENPYSGSYYSNYFDGTGDYLTIPSSANLAFGTGDFCVEMWYYQQTNAFAGLFSNAVSSAGGDAQFEIQIATTTFYPTLLGWATAFLTSSVASTPNAWNHIAVCRSGTTLSMFLNGARVATTTSSNNFSNTNGFNIGRQAANSNYLTGYISNLRVVKGSSVYDPTQSTITRPTTPLTAITNTALLTCQSKTFVDNSSNAFAITKNGDAIIKSMNPFRKNSDSSMYFDGTGDIITARTSPLTAFNTGNFTVEFWLLPTAFASYKSLYGNSSSAASTTGWHTGLNSSGNVFIYGGSAFKVTTTNAMVINQWNHVAIVRSGSTITIYINGTSGGTWALTSETFTDGYCWFGAAPGFNSEYYTGYMADFRLTKGIARYTTTFTPTTSTFKSY